MCSLLKLDYAEFGVSNLRFYKVMKEKLFGGSAPPPPPPLVKEGLRLFLNFLHVQQSIRVTGFHVVTRTL